MPLWPVGAAVIASFVEGAIYLSSVTAALTGAYFAGRKTRGIAAPAPTESEVKKVVNETVKVLLNLTKSGNILQGKKDILKVLEANTTGNQTFDENLVVAAYNETITIKNLTFFQQSLKVVEDMFWYVWPNPLKADSVLPGAKNSLTKKILNYFLSHFFTKSQKRLLIGAPGAGPKEESFFRWFFQDNLNTTSTLEYGAGVENNPSFPPGSTIKSTLGTTGRSLLTSSILILFIVSLVLLMLPFIFDQVVNLYEWLTTQSPRIKNIQSTFFGKFFKSFEQHQLQKVEQEAEIQNIEAAEILEEAVEKVEEAKEDLRASLVKEKQEEQQQQGINDDEKLAKVRAEAQAARARAEVAEALARESVKNAQQAQAVAREVHVVISQLEPKATFYEPAPIPINRYLSPTLRSRRAATGRFNIKSFPLRKRRSPSVVRRPSPSVKRRSPSVKRRLPSVKRRSPSVKRRLPSVKRRSPSVKRRKSKSVKFRRT